MFTTFIDIIQQRLPEKKTIISFVTDKGKQSWSYADLDKRARAIATELQAKTAVNDRVLILLEPGLDYVAAYFACFYAGCIAVPLYPPPRNKIDKRVEAIYQDAEPKAALVHSDLSQNYLLGINHIRIDKIPIDRADQFKKIKREGDNIAFLQYTSGSTADPKGVMVLHRNLLANCKGIHEQFYRPHVIHCGCFWIPPFHDMGLIGGILSPLYSNYETILLAPTKFIRDPLFWLKTISDNKANITATPNFSLDLCVHEIEKNPDIQLDLSCLKVIINGSEPVRAASLQNFCNAFKRYGLDSEAIYPCYGLAEATLIVSSKYLGEKNKIVYVNKNQLIKYKKIELTNDIAQAFALVSCGRAVQDFDLKIVESKTKTAQASWSMGEIWLKGASVTAGYWNKPELNKKIFNAKLTTSDEAYLVTGDLGFLDEKNNLYIMGRTKDVIIIRGSNYYPQDIESVVQAAHPQVIKHGTAAFALEEDGKENLIVVQEVHRHAKDFKSIFNAIQVAMMQEFGITAHRIILISERSLPKTSSGKVQRQLTKKRYQDNSLKWVSEWQPMQATSSMQSDENQTQNEIQAWMLAWVKNEFNLRLSQITVDTNFIELGLDSVYLVRFTNDLEKKYKTTLYSDVIWNNPTIRKLSEYILKAKSNDNAINETNKEDYQKLTQEQAKELLKQIDTLSPEEIKQLLKKISGV